MPGVPTGAAAGTGPGAEPGTRGVRGGIATSGRGFDARRVLIGYGTSDAESYATLMGIATGGTGDRNAQLAALVSDIERRGGLLGRKITLVPHAFSTSEVLNDPNTAAERACVDWTQDHRVFAVVMPEFLNDHLLECLRKHDTPVVNAGGISSFYRPQLDRFSSTLFDVGGMLGDRLEKLLVTRLVARRFFSAWDTVDGRPGSAPMKLGILMVDTPSGDYLLKVRARELARHGVKFDEVVRFAPTLDAITAAHQSAVLRFRSRGITHVMNAGTFFYSTAEGQQYRPRYFVPGVARVVAASTPAEQLEGSMASSWVPLVDVNDTEDPGDPTPASGYCKKLMRAAGQSLADRTSVWTMSSQCDALFFLDAALDAAGALSTPALRAGFERLGSRVSSAVTWTTYFGPGEHASARAVRDLAYDTTCSCFRYTSAQNHLG